MAILRDTTSRLSQQPITKIISKPTLFNRWKERKLLTSI